MELGLTDRLAIITGAAQGIGAAMANAFSDEGASVLLVDRDPKVKEVANRLKGQAWVGELTDPDCSNSIAKLAQASGGVAILINNAGISVPASIPNIQHQDWDAVLSVNLSAAFKLTQALWKQLAYHQGSIINLASFAAKRSTLFGNNASYVASKHGIAGLTRAAAFEGAQQGIQVNAIAPGVVDTDLIKLHSVETRERIKNFIPQKRFATPAEIADLALFLASNRARHICGEVININGGLYMD